MKKIIENNWAQDLAEKIKNDIGLIDDATSIFYEVYHKGGDNIEAWRRFIKSAQVYEFDNGQNCLVVFPDQSCYADWKQGIKRFYTDINDLIAEDDKFKNLLKR